MSENDEDTKEQVHDQDEAIDEALREIRTLCGSL